MKDFSKIDMRDAFFDELYNIASKDKDVILMTADADAFSLHKYKKDFPKQYINTGVSEQSMITAAAGLALSGKKVFIYALIPFIAMRCYEQIKVNICSMNLPITIIGGGAGFSFGYDGPTHHAVCDIAIMRTLPELEIINVSDARLAYASAYRAYKSKTPMYIRLDKGKPPIIHKEHVARDLEFKAGFTFVRGGYDACIISTGIMVQRAEEVAEELAKYNVAIGVIDLYRIKPFDRERLVLELGAYHKLVTLEENTTIGGVGSIVSEIITDYGLIVPLKRIALKDEQTFYYGDRDFLHKKYNIDKESIFKEVLDWI